MKNWATISKALIAICLLGAVGMAAKKYSFLRSVQEISGTIVAFQASPDADDDYATPVIEFEVQNQKIELVNPFMVNDAMFKVKQQVSVIFNPSNPSEAQMKTEAFQYFPTVFLTICAVLLIIIHLLVFKEEN